MRAVFAALVLIVLSAFGHSVAHATEPVKISREDTALDLTKTTEIYRNQGNVFQVSTAAGTDGIVRRIEVRSSNDKHQGDWAVFALANVSDEQLDRVIVAPHFRMVNSKLFWPDLGSERIISITPSEGFALDRLPSSEADVFHITLNPGTVVTFVAELATPELPQLYLWEPEAYKEYGCAEDSLKIADDGNRTALAGDHRCLPERSLERALRRVEERAVEIGAPGTSAVQVRDGHRHPLRRDAGDVRLHRRLDLRRILVWDEPAAHLGHRHRGEDGLRALAGVAAEHPVDLAGRARPDALEGGESLLPP